MRAVRGLSRKRASRGTKHRIRRAPHPHADVGWPPGRQDSFMAQTENLDVASLFRLDGKTAVVVGGYGGLGTMISRLLADAGAQVAIAGRSAEKAQALASELGDAGASAM